MFRVVALLTSESSAASSTTDGNATTTVSKGIDIICTKCYILGSAHARLTSHDTFNATQFTDSAVDAFNETFAEIKNYTTELVDDIEEFVGDTIDTITHLDLGSLEGFDLPAPQIDFNINVTAPDTKLLVDFKDVEVYAELGIILSSGLTYTLNLFSSKELGVQIGSVLVGVVVNLDLILSTETEVDLTTGFHMKLDSALLDITMFADEASHIDLYVYVFDIVQEANIVSHGGKFEFLPVTIETTSAILKAVLRVSVRTGFTAGLDYSRPVELLNRTMSDLQLKAGIEASVYANIAEFTTNVTAADLSKKPHKCDLSVEQGYQFAIGAAAGASIQLFDHIWGPVPKTEIPIFYTNLKEACAATKTASATQTPTPTLQERDDLSTTTTKTELTYSALACASGLVNCPASLMTLSKNIVTSTLTTSVPSGDDVVWSAQRTAATRATPVPFGVNAVTLAPSSGKPSSFVPSTTAAPTVNVDHIINGSTGGVNNKLIIGLSVGLGVPALVAIIAAIM